MSYRPPNIGATVVRTRRKVDGSDTYQFGYAISGNLTAGSTTRSGSIASANITSAISVWGGCLRSNSTFLPIMHNGTVNLVNWGWVSTIDLNGGQWRIRQTPGSNFTGSGNVLSDPIIVYEWIP